MCDYVPPRQFCVPRQHCTLCALPICKYHFLLCVVANVNSMSIVESESVRCQKFLQTTTNISGKFTTQASQPALQNCVFTTKVNPASRMFPRIPGKVATAPNSHWTRARKFAGNSFDAASIQCEHSHSRQVPFACSCHAMSPQVQCGLGLNFRTRHPSNVPRHLFVRDPSPALGMRMTGVVARWSSCGHQRTSEGLFQWS